ncbi:MAG: polysaccharide deacetylase family protein [Bacteroidetes bacterium]|nr:polysaccharide deacetylase family protein [Bacteroidota bacterium]MBS1649110.1 polysaccharide deacetylase family protein [Bacteroidota bacterium]
MIIFATHITNRLQYITTTLFGSNILLTSNVNEYKTSPLFKLNYSFNKIVDDELWIIPHTLLFQSNIQPQNINCFKWNELPIFFKTQGTIPFDVLAASFFLISRYEEYLPCEKDEHGRYNYINSIAYQNNFLHLPLVDLWLKKLKELYPKLSIRNTQFKLLLTYDVDIAFQYLHHSTIKNIFLFYKELFKGNFNKVVEQGNVFSGRKKDPFNDVFNWLDDLHKKYKLQPIYFLLILLNRNKYDVNVLASSKAIKKLYKQLSEKYTVGLHPSYKSSEGKNKKLFIQEKNILSAIIQKNITVSRNHYLCFSIPQTYRMLIQQGFTDDYSMAFAGINGFRASTSNSFFWFDIERNEATVLQIHPFSFMDATSFFYQKNSPQQAYNEMLQYYEIIKYVDGTFITLFHNHFLTEQPEWMEWRKMYEKFLATVSNMPV